MKINRKCLVQAIASYNAFVAMRLGIPEKYQQDEGSDSGAKSRGTDFSNPID